MKITLEKFQKIEELGGAGPKPRMGATYLIRAGDRA